MANDEHSFEELTPEEAAERAGYSKLSSLAKASIFGRETGVPVCGTCGCRVEPDNCCVHGFQSALRKAGMV